MTLEILLVLTATVIQSSSRSICELFSKYMGALLVQIEGALVPKQVNKVLDATTPEDAGDLGGEERLMSITSVAAAISNVATLIAGGNTPNNTTFNTHLAPTLSNGAYYRTLKKIDDYTLLETIE